MSLTYIEYPSYKNDIKKVYLNSFPKEERFPFGILEECAKEKNLIYMQFLIMKLLLECIL